MILHERWILHPVAPLCIFISESWNYRVSQNHANSDSISVNSAQNRSPQSAISAPASRVKRSVLYCSWFAETYIWATALKPSVCTCQGFLSLARYFKPLAWWGKTLFGGTADGAWLCPKRSQRQTFVWEETKMLLFHLLLSCCPR